jgi:hypothetical protein
MNEKLATITPNTSPTPAATCTNTSSTAPSVRVCIRSMRRPGSTIRRIGLMLRNLTLNRPTGAREHLLKLKRTVSKRGIITMVRGTITRGLVFG